MIIITGILALFIAFNLDHGLNPNLPWIAVMVGIVADTIMAVANAIKDLARAYREGNEC